VFVLVSTECHTIDSLLPTFYKLKHDAEMHRELYGEKSMREELEDNGVEFSMMGKQMFTMDHLY
jgi:hypothetical protein